MLCYKDMCFCYDALYCNNSELCGRQCSGKDRELAYILGLPVCMSSMKGVCKDWESNGKEPIGNVDNG